MLPLLWLRPILFLLVASGSTAFHCHPRAATSRPHAATTLVAVRTRQQCSCSSIGRRLAEPHEHRYLRAAARLRYPSVLRASSTSSRPHGQGLEQPQQEQQQQHGDRLVPGSNGGGGNGGGGGVSLSDRSTLGVEHRVLEQTLVPRLAGAVLKQSPLDFVVVEIPQGAAPKFTPADPNEPVPKEARKPVVHKIPSPETAKSAITAWKERWAIGGAFEGPAEPPQEEPEQSLWNLGRGFDVLASRFGAPATVQFLKWLVDVSARATFDAEEDKREAAGGTVGMILPPPEPPLQIYLQCPATLDKAGRTDVHQAFRSHMAYFSTTAIMPRRPSGGTGGGGGVVSDNFLRKPPLPVPDDGKVYFEISFDKSRSRVAWPKGRGEYLEFSVYKAGRSTSEIVDALSRHLYVKHTRVSFAGQKDRRALTAQKMRCWRLEAEDVHQAQADGRLATHGLAVSDFRYVDKELSLGGLKGNHFEVLLRPPQGGWGCGEAAAAAAAAARGGKASVSAAEAFRRLRDEGFVNFFGEQRFGRDGTNNVDVGMLILGGDFAGAIDRIMAPHAADTDQVVAAKDAFFRGVDYTHTLSLLPRTAFTERKIIQALREVRSDPLRAMLEVPRETSLLFVQAYQSLLWNQAASRRMGGEFDTRMAIEGDLVLVKGGKPLTAWDTRPSEGADIKIEVLKEKNDLSAARQEAATEVATVSAEDVLEGVFSIKHVVLPLPGHSVKFPLNSVGDAMLATLKQDCVDDVILTGHPQKQFDLEGAYRHVVVHPRNFDVVPVPPGEEDEEGHDEEDDFVGDRDDAAAAVADQRRAAQIGAARTAKGGMAPSTTAKWLRARFRREVKQRFKGTGNSSSGSSSNSSSSSSGGSSSDISGGTGGTSGSLGGGGGEGAKSLTAIRVSFSLPLGAYATSLLQHVTGEGLYGREKAWHTRNEHGGRAGDRDSSNSPGCWVQEDRQEHEQREWDEGEDGLVEEGER